MESGLDLLRSERVRERHLLINTTQQVAAKGKHAYMGSPSRVSNITREQTVMMQVARSFNVKDGQLSSVLACGNPAEERRLATQLKKIEDEKRRRESTLAWNQRNFFIKQVFDQDNELRFVKVYERPSYLKQTAAEDEFEETIHLRPKSRSVDFGKESQHDRPKSKPLRRSKTEGALLLHRKKKHILEDKFDSSKIVQNGKENVDQTEHVLTDDLPKLTQIDSIRVSEETNPELKAKVKFPLLKVRALGIFAASFKRNEQNAGKENTKLPPPIQDAYITSNLNENTSTTSNQSNTNEKYSNKKYVDTLDNGPLVNTTHNEQNVDKHTHQVNGNAVSKNIHINGIVQSSKKYVKTTEYKIMDIGLESTDRYRNGENTSSKDNKSRDVLGKRKQREGKVKHFKDPEKDEKLQVQQEKVLRKLVSTLPTHLLLKTHKREKEAGGISTDEVRRKMIDKARAGMSQRVLKDPRFKNLEDFLNAGKNATYNPESSSTKILDNDDDY
ncbi:uncharacterized protein [Antedon mediterranea]|uniref:uncharacterized protein isoform X2 n=1 Tax=Antedon mediterranea TaxID=105859 RepID=UPI003AF909CA